ncbi:MAG: SDR family oxidoreductase [Deltaproteobacteria bacterium]|nr:SDR family oxidoreductase [Deltaproteobacteria bacterium]
MDHPKTSADALRGQVAVVTGASRGIGRAIAVTLAKAGASVLGCSRTGEGRGFLADLPDAIADRCRFEACDVRRFDEIERFSRRNVAQFGAADILVNNAGVVTRSNVEDTSEAAWNDVIAANLTGSFLITRAFLPGMKAKKSGRIINIASIAGRQGTAMLSAYCAAKHGVIGLTRAVCEEVREYGIAVNAVCPGSVDTEMLRVGMPGGVARITTAEVADVVLFLAATAPITMTGSCLDVFA